MQNRKLMIGIIVLAVVVIGWYLFRPELLFVNKTVNEQFPVSTVVSTVSGPLALSTGNFRGLAHETKGMATIYQLPDGKRTLRLTQFETSNGPDVRVYLVAAPDAKDNDTVKKAGFIDLGAMKGNRCVRRRGSWQVSVGQHLVPAFWRQLRHYPPYPAARLSESQRMAMRWI